jgi:hypothetical protein
MIFNTGIYYCNECKKVIENVSNLLFVEQGSSRGFCSEDCIEEFYSPLILFFESEIIRQRKIFDIIEEEIVTEHEDDFFVEELSRNPDEVYCLVNELKEETYLYFKRKKDFFIMMICTRFNNEPSFIFSITKSKSQKFINEFKVGLKVNLENSIEENEVEEDIAFLELLENKKSSLLAELLSCRSENDIPFENFSNFEISFEETLENPDEIYELKDRDGDLVFNYLKSFMDQNIGSFFYIIVGLKKIIAQNDINVYPILTFPTKDLDLYKKFRAGTKVLSVIKN